MPTAAAFLAAELHRCDELLPELLRVGGRHSVTAWGSLIPAEAGVYLFSDGGEHLYVGQTRDLRRRLRQHTSRSSRHGQAAFAWLLACQEAKARRLDLSTTRAAREQEPAFAEVFDVAKLRVAAMAVGWVLEPDPIRRTLFEMYAALVLRTPHNSFETH